MATIEYQVSVPPGVFAGQPFQVNVGGQLMQVTCPQGVGPGQAIRIRAPAPAAATAASYAAAPRTVATDVNSNGAGIAKWGAAGCPADCIAAVCLTREVVLFVLGRWRALPQLLGGRRCIIRPWVGA